MIAYGFGADIWMWAQRNRVFPLSDPPLFFPLSQISLSPFLVFSEIDPKAIYKHWESATSKEKGWRGDSCAYWVVRRISVSARRRELEPNLQNRCPKWGQNWGKKTKIGFRRDSGNEPETAKMTSKNWFRDLPKLGLSSHMAPYICILVGKLHDRRF